MNRERFARIAARTYPADARTARGAELVGTLLEAGEESRTAFVRQLGSVFRAGITARVRIALTQPTGQLVVYALAWAAVMAVFRDEVGTLGFAVRFLEHGTGRIVFPAGTFVTWVLPALVVLAFILKQSRISGLLGVALIVSRFVLEPVLDPWEIAQFVLPAAGFLLMTIAPNRIPSSGRWVFVVPAAVFLFFAVTQIGFFSGADIIVPLLVTLCFLPIAPAFAIGTGLAWSVPMLINLIVVVSGPGRWTALPIALIACAPLTVTATWLGRRQAQHR